MAANKIAKTRMLRGRSVSALLVVAIAPALLLSACSGATPRPTATATPSPTAEAWRSTYVAPPATVLTPLRGTIAPAKGGLDHPSLAVKIDNHTAARPQIGLERADIVFEELVEGGITRYVGVWHSDIPKLLGPVRSIRPMDPDIIRPFGGIVAYSGGQPHFVDLMMKTPVVNAVFDYDRTGLFYRAPGRTSPHNVIVKAQDLVARNAKLAPPVQQFAYAVAAPAASAVVDGKPVRAINTRFSNARWPSWAWDAAGQSYLRAQEGAPDRDSTGAQLKATNVIVLRVGIDGRYGDVPTTKMLGSGEAWVSAGGKTVHGTWSKGSQAARIRLVDDHGVAIRLAPGNTWIELVPLNTGSVQLLP